MIQMHLLADTQVLIWFGNANPKLSPAAQKALVDPDNRVFVSVVSHWEIELKQQRHPEFLLGEPIQALMARAEFESLDLTFSVPAMISTLPPIHKDPYDRILVAQALHHELTLVTSDRKMRRYPVPTLW